MPEISEARMKELADNWNEETNDPETEEWRDHLTPEEVKIVADWDNGYAVDVHKLCQDILALYREGERNG
jgi:hypothetical protein